jgi:hypothetical protein
MEKLRGSISYSALIMAMAAAPAAAQVIVPGVGWEAGGADLVVLQLDTDPRPDMILMAYDNPAGANSFRYKVGMNLNAAGNPATPWGAMVQVPGVGWEGQGAGAATADLDGNGRPELILMAYDNPAQANNFRYKIGWNLNSGGTTNNWTSHNQVAGVGWEGQGAAAVIGQIDNDPRPDMIFIAYDNPAQANTFRYRVGFNLDAAGNATWSPGFQTVAGVGWEGQGLGAALARIDSNPRPDLVLMAYDNPAQGNSFRAKTGLNLNTAGVGTWSNNFQTIPGVGWEGQGAGLAITCLDSDPRGDWIAMAYDNPAQANTFRYRVVLNNSPAPCGPAVSAPQRKSITQLTPQELASLRRGFTQMIAWNSAPQNSANYRRSLQYWANMHAYFGTGCAPVSGLSAPGMSGLTSFSSQLATWCTCQHNNPQFATWHRMYLYYFEQVLQQAAGDPNLRLPFWDYETNGQLPQAYRDATWVNQNGQTVPNPLRVNNRQSQLNAGTGTLGGNTTSTSSAMAQTSYGLFNSTLESGPHGPVHCATGVSGCGTGYMGSVPAAGNDPIFYSHHANIDRLYECWVRVNPATRLPSGAMLNTSFSFVDGAGNVVSRTVGSMLTTTQLGYTYAAGGGCPAGTEDVGDTADTADATDAAGGEPEVVGTFDAAGAVRLERGVTRVPVRVDSDIGDRLNADSAGNPRSLLVIEGLTFDEAPRVLYNVYIEGPGGRRAFVGVIHFFGRGPDHAGHPGADRVVLDATEALRTLGLQGDATPNLIFEPDTGIEEDSTDTAVRQISPRANVRFARARFQVVE